MKKAFFFIISVLCIGCTIQLNGWDASIQSGQSGNLSNQNIFDQEPMASDVVFETENGLRLQGTIYYPTHYIEGAKYPAVIANSGYTGLKDIYPRVFAKALTQKGYVVFGFDYRGNGMSEGTPNRIILDEQVQDILCALDFFTQQNMVEAQDVGLIGWGMAGGLIFKVAAKANANKVGAVRWIAPINGFFSGDHFYQNYRKLKSEEEYAQLVADVEVYKEEEITSGRETYIPLYRAYPLDPATELIVDKELRPVKNYGGKIQGVSYKLFESIRHFSVDEDLPQINAKVYIAHGKENLLHPLWFAEFLHEQIPEAFFYTINGAHNDFMNFESPVFRELIHDLVRTIRKSGANE